MIRLLTDGGYPSLFNYVGELFPIDKRGYLYYITVKGEEYVFFPDEVEIVTVFYEDNVGKQLLSVATMIVVTAIAITIIISVIF
jgi:hypothetical protein